MEKDRFSPSTLDSVLSDLFRDRSGQLLREIERTLMRPLTPSSETRFTVKRWHRTADLRALAIFSWYLGGAGEFLRLDLKEKPEFSRGKDKYSLAVLLISKERMLEYLCKIWTTRAFFGNHKDHLLWVTRDLHFLCLVPRSPRRRVRRRGHRDATSCRSLTPRDCFLPTSVETEEQNRIEEERRNFARFQQSLGVFGLIGVRLPELEV